VPRIPGLIITWPWAVSLTHESLDIKGKKLHPPLNKCYELTLLLASTRRLRQNVLLHFSCCNTLHLNYSIRMKFRAWQVLTLAFMQYCRGYALDWQCSFEGLFPERNVNIVITRALIGSIEVIQSRAMNNRDFAVETLLLY
jgi:hypothetical protein